MPDEWITRAEFTAQVQRLDARIDKAETSDSTVKVQLDARLDKLSDKIDTVEKLLSSQITSLREDVFRQRNGALKFALSTVLSFIVGGGAVELLRFLVLGKP